MVQFLPPLPRDEQERVEALMASDREYLARKRRTVFGPTVTVPSTPDQPADHYEGGSPNPLAYDPLSYQAGGSNDPTDDDWATGGSTPADEVDARNVNSYDELAED